MLRLPVSFRHLSRLTDDTGLLEHCMRNIPRRREGYTTDDNARALWVCVEWAKHAEASGDENMKEKLYGLMDRYLAFLLWVQKEDGSFHNNVGYDRVFEEETPSDDCLGRTLWACAVTAAKLNDEDRKLVALDMFNKGLKAAERLTYPRGWAYALAACSLMAANGFAGSPGGVIGRFSRSGNGGGSLRRFTESGAGWDFAVEDPLRENTGSDAVWGLLERLEEKLIRSYRECARKDWRWFEPVMTYGNGVLPWALFFAYEVTKRKETLEVAKESLDFLISKMTSPNGTIRPIGNRGWCTPDFRSDWDQQPLEAMKLALAAAQAWKTTGDEKYRTTLHRCRAWFHGENDLNVPLANVKEGSCCDGLMPEGVNRNQGAESTLSYLLTESIYRDVEQECAEQDEVVKTSSV